VILFECSFVFVVDVIAVVIVATGVTFVFALLVPLSNTSHVSNVVAGCWCCLFL
jgi:hypothetical protein